MATSFLSMHCNWIQVLVLLTLALDVVAKWNATGNLRTIWVTHVMEYRDLFSPEQAGMFAEDVKKAYGDFLVERSDPATRRGIKPQSEHSSTPADKDRINEEFFNYQGRHPINEATLEIVWQAFCYAVARFVKEADLPPIEYQRETAEGGSLEWVTTAVGMPRRGRQYCWGSVQSEGTHHDIHVHPGSALAGTLYLSVPLDGGALTLSDPRGPVSTPVLQQFLKISEIVCWHSYFWFRCHPSTQLIELHPRLECLSSFRGHYPMAFMARLGLYREYQSAAIFLAIGTSIRNPRQFSTKAIGATK